MVVAAVFVLAAAFLVPLLGAGAQDCAVRDPVTNQCLIETSTTVAPTTTTRPGIPAITPTVTTATAPAPTTTTQPAPAPTPGGAPPPSAPAPTDPAGPAPATAPAPDGPISGRVAPTASVPASGGPAAAPAVSAPAVPVAVPAATGPVSIVRDAVLQLDPSTAAADTLRTPISSSALLSSLVDQIASIQRRRSQDVWVEIAAPFPVAGPVYYRDDFGEFRIGPPVHGHAGNDIFAGKGTPVVAPADGRVDYQSGGLGGLGFNLYTADNTRIFCTHLAAIPTNVADRSVVRRGQVIGFVGESGNAAGGPSHCHFEIHPHDGPAVNPKPFLDQWLAQAQAQATSMLVSLGGKVPSATTAPARRLSGFDRYIVDLVSAPGSSKQAGAGVLAGLAPTAAGLDLAGSTAALAQVDWNLPAGVSSPAEAAVVRRVDAARTVTAGLTPPALAPALGLPSSAVLSEGSHDASSPGFE